ncbi:MAG: DUF6382 domain-containing protein [Lentihominibacter sp.]
MWENREYRLNFTEESILGFERIMLSSGQCSSLLPMVFISEETELLAYYDCEGFVPLSSYRIDRTEDALFILEQVLLIMNSLVEYLINSEKILLSTETVFYNPDTGEIKIAYVPDSKHPEMRRHILSFIAYLKSEITDGNKGMLDAAARMVYENKYRLMDLVNRIGMLRRRLYC